MAIQASHVTKADMPRSAVSFWVQSKSLFRDCRVELASLVIAIGIIATLGQTGFPELLEWDANGVVMVVALVWMAVCVALYQWLQRTSR
jgi:hypothetical protein